MPTYNSATTVSDAVLSIYKNLGDAMYLVEVLVCDDASTDETRNVLENLKINYPIKVFYNSINSGPGYSRNICLDHAVGDWVLFLDSDDKFNDGAIFFLIDKIKEINGSKTDLILFNDVVGKSNVLIHDYLRLRKDGSVIFSCVRASLIREYEIRFSDGYHEDVDVQFKFIFYAKEVCSLSNILYDKFNRPNSIVNSISERHITGFFRAWQEIFNLISADKNLINQYTIGIVALVATRVREVLKNEASLDRQIELLNFIYENLNSFLNANKLLIDRKLFDTKYYKIYQILTNEWVVFDKRAALKLIKDALMKKWSCHDLQNSVFLGPDEIRTCCKRFFVGGQMMGDVVLYKTASMIPTATTILSAKNNLIKAINSGDQTPCSGCPYLEFKEWGDIADAKFSYISMEHHSICNLKCTYCSDKYHGGMKTQYDIEYLLKSLFAKNTISQSATFVWGGGEPTNLKNFDEMIDLAIGASPQSVQRVLSNSVKYSKKLQTLIDEEKVYLTTSVDAGTSEKFLEVRGNNKLKSVINNLRKYSANKPQQITIKYIFTESNSLLDEIKSFSELISSNNLISCNFQISSDFKNEFIEVDNLALLIAMYSLLTSIGVETIFWDDLISNRLISLSDEDRVRIADYLNLYEIENPIAQADEYSGVSIWGAGWQAKAYIEKTTFFKNVSLLKVVDDTPSKLGAEFFGRKIEPSGSLLKDDSPIIIAAVQGYGIIYNKALAMGINKERILKKLII